MIQVKNLMKQFDDIIAVNDITAEIQEGSIFGLIGTNGAGKSTFIRMLCGILAPDRGEIMIDGQTVFENAETKKKFFYISDDQFFFPNATALEMMSFYQKVYPSFDAERFHRLMKQFELEENRKLSTFSKGMKKQVSVICGICAGTKYLFCDETFDGLDPVMRQAVKSLLANDMEERELTTIIASHNLRELEDICDHVGLLHKGGILFSKDMEELKLNIHKLQCVLPEGTSAEDLHQLDIIRTEKRGKLLTLTIRGNESDIREKIDLYHPIFAEIIPLSLEEIFISETEVVGYDIKKLIL